jgi:hypothetical protein
LVILFFFACVAFRVSGDVTTKNLLALMKGLNEVASEEEVATFLSEMYPDSNQEIEFESFLRVHASHRFSELLNCNAVRNGAVFSIYSVGIGEPDSISAGVSESAGEGECQSRWRWCWWWGWQDLIVVPQVQHHYVAAQSQSSREIVLRGTHKHLSPRRPISEEVRKYLPIDLFGRPLLRWTIPPYIIVEK